MFAELRNQFPALTRQQAGQPVVYLDGPAGSQVPQSVIDAISNYYSGHNANRCGQFATSHETDELMEDAHCAAAAWFGTDDPHETVFGANMTTLTFQFSRALARTWSRGDTVVVTQLDHDANVSPWRLAAADIGAQLRVVGIKPEDATLDLHDFARALELKPKLVAVTAASNSVGSRTPLRELISMAHAAGAEVYVDAVHLAPHALLDVVAWDADYVVCSAYKFFGPHVGLLWARKQKLRELQAYKVQPAPDTPPGKWMTGTQNHAAICGVTAAIDYLCAIGRKAMGDLQAPRRKALASAMSAIELYERSLFAQLMAGLLRLPGITVFGITDPDRFDMRVPTVSFAANSVPATVIAQQLAQRGIYCWHGHYYAIALCEALGQQAHGMVRLGLMHINTAEEVERTLMALAEIL
jgi:cysteine desulfurase family protein (TIGR01976 family)